MGRRLGVLLVMALVLVALAWAGVMNLRARRAAVEANHVDLIPARAGDGATQGIEGAELEGKAAPSFTLTRTDGKKVSLSEYKGHPVLVNFWATWCGPCKLEMPWLQEFSKKYADQGFVILGLSQDEDKEPTEVAQAARHLGVDYQVLMPDKDEHVAKAYGGVDYLPESFYVDRSGKVVHVAAGAPSKDQLEALIQNVIASK